MRNFRKDKRKSGYTLLFAVLTASLVLGVAAFILGVARKQYVLSSTARDSMYSFYAADSGLECLDKYNSSDLFFGTSTVPTIIDCAGQSRSISYPTTYSDNGPYRTWSISTTFGFAADNANPTIDSNRWGCAVVTLSQKFDMSSGEPWKMTTILDSKGYNLCDYDLLHDTNYTPQKSSRTVERALQLVTE